MFYGFDVVGRVISILQQLNVDLDSVTLEQAKILAFAVIIEHRSNQLGVDGPDPIVSFCDYQGESGYSRSGK